MTLPADPPSPANRDPIAIPQVPIAEQRWASLLFLFRVSPSYLKRWPSSTQHEEGSDVARMGRGSLVELVQSQSNHRPIANFGGETSACSFQPLPASRFAKHPLARHKRKTFRTLRGNSCTSPRSQNQRDVRRHRTMSKLTINLLPFRGPIAGLPRLEFYQSRSSTSCRCPQFLDMQLRTAPIYPTCNPRNGRPMAFWGGGVDSQNNLIHKQLPQIKPVNMATLHPLSNLVRYIANSWQFTAR